MTAAPSRRRRRRHRGRSHRIAPGKKQAFVACLDLVGPITPRRLSFQRRRTSSPARCRCGLHNASNAVHLHAKHTIDIIPGTVFRYGGSCRRRRFCQRCRRRCDRRCDPRADTIAAVGTAFCAEAIAFLGPPRKDNLDVQSGKRQQPRLEQTAKTATSNLETGPDFTNEKEIDNCIEGAKKGAEHTEDKAKAATKANVGAGLPP